MEGFGVVFLEGTSLFGEDGLGRLMPPVEPLDHWLACDSAGVGDPEMRTGPTA